MAHASTLHKRTRGSASGEWELSARTMVLLALVIALLAAWIVLARTSGFQDVGRTARNMAAHPIVRMPARFHA